MEIRDLNILGGQVVKLIRAYFKKDQNPNVVLIVHWPGDPENKIYWTGNIPMDQSRKMLRDIAGKIGQQLAEGDSLGNSERP